MIIPKRITIETIFGCNANCVMCVINHSTKRKKGIMNMELFKNIVDSLIPYNNHFEMMDLYSLGEPLLDKYFFERVRYVKENGFNNVGMSTNADLLDKDKQKLLLESKIDTVLFSIDGVSKQTHESIRRGVIFERVVQNIKSIINMRNKKNYLTRFGLRFIRQDINKNEWRPFKQHWGKIISKSKGDFITVYDMHSWGGNISYQNKLPNSNFRHKDIDRLPCPDIFNVLYILSNGIVPLCHEDWLHPNFNFGNVNNTHPIEIFNNQEFQRIRKIHNTGKKSILPICRKCTCLYSSITKEIV